MADAPVYRLEVACSALGLEFRLNDFPVFVSRGGGATRNASINHWIVDGTNPTVVNLTPADAELGSTEGPFARVAVFLGETELYAFDTGASVARPPVIPSTATGSFDSGSAFGLWRWQEAPPVEPAPPVLAGLAARVQEIHSALSEADLDRTAAFLRLKAEEQARAFGLPVDDRVAEQRRFFGQLFAEPTWGLEPLAPETLGYALCADARVVAVQGPEGAHVIRSLPDADEMSFSLPLFMSLLDGEWTVVR